MSSPLFFVQPSGSSEPANRGRKLSLLRLTPLFLASRGLTARKSRGVRDTAFFRVFDVNHIVPDGCIEILDLFS